MPVPLSPSSITVALLRGTFSIVRHTRNMASSRVINPAKASLGASVRRRAFSACNS